jgi:phosphoribosylformylglycinamidine cyclo-ligase
VIDRRTTYRDAGVDTAQAEQALSGLLKHITGTFSLRRDLGAVVLPVGFFANVIRLRGNVGIAISTDGVGSKVLIAQMLDKYDTIGIDCVAMNVNDVLCVGAEPLSLVDYIAVQAPDPHLMEELAKGLAAGAALANITISGGEIAQLPDVIKGHRVNQGFDLAGTCIGQIDLDRLVLGTSIQPGDAIVGIRSNGVHSNGLTLARKALFEEGGFRADSLVADLDGTIGEELLKPTHIYVRPVLEAMRAGIDVRGLAHITSDGFLNLSRLQAESPIGYEIEALPSPHPIFSLIQTCGDVADT